MATERKKAASKVETARAAGSEDLEAGASLLDAAGDAAGKTVALVAEGAADVTRGEDELVAAEALSDLSDVAAAKGVRDATAGAITLDAAEDVAAVGALMAAVTADNLDRGMLLASLSGQLRVASDVVDLMDMPVLSGFLGMKGRQLRGLAVNEIGRAMAAAALAQGMDSMAERLAALGLGEVAAGLQELETADVLLDARDAAASSGGPDRCGGSRRAVRCTGGSGRHASAHGRGGRDGRPGCRGGGSRRRPRGWRPEDEGRQGAQRPEAVGVSGGRSRLRDRPPYLRRCAACCSRPDPSSRPWPRTTPASASCRGSTAAAHRRW